MTFPKIKFMALGLLALVKLSSAASDIKVAPYVDVTLNFFNGDYLTNIQQQTGLEAVTLAFILGGGSCEPKWGAQKPVEDASIMSAIKNFKAKGGKVILATGGAAGQYMEASCATPEALAAAYKKALTVVGTNHLDIDIEGDPGRQVDQDKMFKALKILRAEMPDLKISFTFTVQNDEQGIVDGLGVNVLQKSKTHGVPIDLVNIMSMEFHSSKANWGDAVVASGEATVRQMKQIWPEKSEAELYGMLGVTPMIGRNFMGMIFELDHARQLVAWAQQKGVGQLAFWSLARDSGKCAGGGVSYDCSSIAQQDWEFTRIFNEYATSGSGSGNPPTSGPSNPITPKPNPSDPVDCSSGASYVAHETDCAKYYWCVNGNPNAMQCSSGLVFDPQMGGCNWASAAGRTDCV